jgi:hypothetical protein
MSKENGISAVETNSNINYRNLFKIVTAAITEAKSFDHEILSTKRRIALEMDQLEKKSTDLNKKFSQIENKITSLESMGTEPRTTAPISSTAALFQSESTASVGSFPQLLKLRNPNQSSK